MERQSFIQPTGYRLDTVVTIIILGSLLFGLGYLNLRNPDTVPCEREISDFVKSTQFLVFNDTLDIAASQYSKSTYRISSDLYGKTDDFFQKRWRLPPSNATYIQGMTFVSDRYCPNITFFSDEALYSLKAIYSAGIDWVAIVVTEYQNNTKSDIISPVFDPIYLKYYTHISSSVSDLKFIINAAHKIGLRVMLKPHIDLLSDRDGPWRGNIQADDDKTALWFESYTAMILKYAVLSQALEVEIMSLECELIGMSDKTASWRQVIKEIRQVYDGKLLSAANYGGEEVSTLYWDDLDFIGVDAYYLNWVQINNNSVEQIMQQWSQSFQIMKSLSHKFNKPVIITEIGFCSGYCNRAAADQSQVPSYQVMQANQYEALLLLLQVNSDWLKGIFFWSWNSDPAFGGENDICISPQYKKAEDIIRKYWGEREYIPKPTFPAKCPCTL